MKKILQFPKNKYISIRMSATQFQHTECGQEVILTGVISGQDYPKPDGSDSKNARIEIQLINLKGGEKPKTIPFDDSKISKVSNIMIGKDD